MPIRYNFDKQSELVIVVATGFVSVGDRRALVDLLINDNSLPEIVPVLIDVTRIVNQPSPNDVKMMSILVEVILRRFKAKVAYYVVQPGFVTPYILATLQADCDSSKIQTFMDYEEALSWLVSN
ncbi:MAG: hypothetical protein U0930_25240 [Pirellulales bacterium]